MSNCGAVHVNIGNKDDSHLWNWAKKELAREIGAGVLCDWRPA